MKVYRLLVYAGSFEELHDALNSIKPAVFIQEVKVIPQSEVLAVGGAPGAVLSSRPGAPDGEEQRR
jgi:hypothetical protein